MADRIDIDVVVNGADGLQNLSVAMRTLLISSTKYANSLKNLDSRQRAINIALGKGSQAAGDHAKNLRQVITNQQVLGEEIRRTTADLKRFSALAKAGIGGPGMAGAVRNLEQTSKAMRGVKARAFASDMRSVGIEMKRVGKDAQFVGRSIIIGLTTPLIAFGRVGVQNFYAVEKQLTRLKKLMGEFADETGRALEPGELGKKVNYLADSATKLSYEFGIAKEMVLAITGDFAELGVNSEETLGNLSKLAVQIAVLGDMDVSSAKDLTQTLFLGSMNALQMTGRMKEFNTVAEAQQFAIKNVTMQMAMFNSVENATALSMREIAATLPEVSAAGQAFGLNFNEMMSFLAPMKAIGIDVNAAATGIKVSFQKLVNPTIKMTKELQRLSDAARDVGDIDLAESFLGIKNIGMESIQSLVDVTVSLMNASDEELLDFYSELFDDRQSTRMLAAMRDLANFQNSMFRTSVKGVVSAEKEFVDIINKSLSGTGLLVNDIKSLSEVTSLANISFKQLNASGTVFVKSLGREVTKAEIEAARRARKDVAAYIKSEFDDKGRNFIEDMSSEAGKVLAISFAGGASASEFASKELDAAINATSTSIDRIKVAFKNLTAGIINDLAPYIRQASEMVSKIVQAFLNMNPAIRKAIIFVGMLATAIGPLVFIFGVLRMSLGTVLENLFKLLPGLKAIRIESLHSRSGLLYLSKGLTMMGDTVQNNNSRFATFIATLSGGRGPIARLAKTFGELTGIMSKTPTAAADVYKGMNAAASLKQENALKILTNPKAGVPVITPQYIQGLVNPAAASNVFPQAVTTPSVMSPQNISQVVNPAGVTPQNVIPPVQRPIPGQLALPAAGQTSKASKWLPLRGPGGRMMPRFTQKLGPRPTPFWMPDGPLALPAAGQTSTAGKFPAIRGPKGRMVPRITTFGPAIPMGPGPEIPVPKTKAQISKEFAAARKKAKAAREALNKNIIDASVREEKDRINKIVSKAKSIKPFDKKAGSFTDQLFETVGIGGSADQSSRRFVDDAIAREKARTQTRPRKILRTALRKGPVARFMPGAVGAALPFEREITPNFMQRKFTGERMTDKVSGATKTIKDSFGRSFDAIDSRAKRFGSSMGKTFSAVGSGVKSSMTSAANVAGSALTSVGKKGVSAGNAVYAGMSKAGSFTWSKMLSGADSAFNSLKQKVQKNRVVRMVMFMKDMATKVVQFFIVHVKAARAAVASLNAQGKGAGLVGFFRKATSAAWNFVRSVIVGEMSLKSLIAKAASTRLVQFFMNATKAAYAFAKANLFAGFSVKLLGKAFMGIAIIAVIMVIVAGVLYLIDVFKKMGDKSKVVSSNLKAAWEAISGAIGAIIAPIKDTIGTIMQLIGGVAGGAGNTGDAMKNISVKIREFAESIKEFVEKYVAPVIEFIMVRVIDFIKGVWNFIKGFIDLFKGNFKDGFASIVKGLAQFARIFIDIWMALAKINIDIIARLAKAIVSLFGEAINAIADGVAAFAADVVGLGEALLGWVPWVGDGIRSVQNWLNEIEAPMDGITNTINGVIDGAANVAKGLVDGVGGKLLSWIESLAGEQTKIVKDSLKDTEEAVDETLGDDETYDPWIDAMNDAGAEAGETAGEAFKKAFEDAMKDLSQKFVDLVLDSLKESIDDAMSKLEEALEKQKEKALAVYDSQIEALEKLEKAEESLTKEKEYQLERRKMLDERELQRTNYIRNRALAIYEGRIDDARMFSLQEQVDQREFTANLTKLDDDRRRDLVKENLDYLKDAIKTAQEETARLIDEQIAKFQEAAKEITKFPPLTIEEYTLQLKQLNDIAVGIAGENGNILKTMMDSMATNLQMPNENLGVFSTGLDKLVSIAQQKYGLLSDTNKNTIVGATVAMLTGIQGQMIGFAPLISNAFQGIVTDVFDVASSFAELSSKIIAPALADIQNIIVKNNPFTAFENAVKFANETILREMQRTVGHVASVVDTLTRHISQTLIELTRAQVALEQAAQQAQDTINNMSPGNPGSPGGSVGVSLSTLTSQFLGSRLSGSADSIERQMTSIMNALVPIMRDVKASGAGKATQVADYLTSIGATTFPNNHIIYLLRNSSFVSQAIQSSFYNGGKVPGFAKGGSVVAGYPSQSVPAMLHGGEYVMSSKAVSGIGIAALDALNSLRLANVNQNGLRGISNMKYDVPMQKAIEVLNNLDVGRHGATTQGAQTNHTENINIYVENFVGQEEWFKTMVKQYNMTVLPMKQKSAGMENRVVTSYTGLSRGM